jgi:hypothetical protein
VISAKVSPQQQLLLECEDGWGQRKFQMNEAERYQ